MIEYWQFYQIDKTDTIRLRVTVYPSLYPFFFQNSELSIFCCFYCAELPY